MIRTFQPWGHVAAVDRAWRANLVRQLIDACHVEPAKRQELDRQTEMTALREINRQCWGKASRPNEEDNTRIRELVDQLVRKNFTVDEIEILL